jgi:hypothetical protein
MNDRQYSQHGLKGELPRFFELTGLWASFPLSDVLALLFGQVWMNIEFKRRNISFLWWKRDIESSKVGI